MDCEFIVREGAILVARLDNRVYGQTAVLKIAHRFLNRCFLHLQSDGCFTEVRLRPKKAEVDAEVLMGDFINEALDQRLRDIVAADTEPVRNLILAHALSETCLLHPEFEGQDLSSDPSNLMVPDDAKRIAP